MAKVYWELCLHKADETDIIDSACLDLKNTTKEEFDYYYESFNDVVEVCRDVWCEDNGLQERDYYELDDDSLPKWVKSKISKVTVSIK